MNILCTICARGGSTGVPGKNIREVAGKPLIAHTIEMANKVSRFEHVVVSTDCPEIAQVAKEYGAAVPFLRPKELANDTISKFPALRHAVLSSEEAFATEFTHVVDLDPTSPLRCLEDIDECIDLVLEKNISNVITATAARRSPYFNLIEKDSLGRISISKVIDPAPTCRQDSPECFDMNASIYAWKKEKLMGIEVPIFLEETELYVMPEERSVDLDSELDAEIIEMLLLRKSNA